MSNRKYNPGISKLANVMDNRVNEIAQSRDFPTLDFASVNSDYSLKLNQFNPVIPKEDYVILSNLNIGESDSEFAETTISSHSHSGGEHGGHESGTGEHSHSGGEHKHNVKLPEKFAKLLPGDRVLVCWVQNTVVVIGKIESAEDL